MLPTKDSINNWTCTSVIERLMYENKWPRKVAQQWFSDFMRWLYSAERWKEEKLGAGFIMDGCHYLDEVWHAYILHSTEYFKMSKELFGIDYIHHVPAPSFKKEKISPQTYEAQLMFLLADWGEEYIDRVWNYGADMSDIIGANDYEVLAT